MASADHFPAADLRSLTADVGEWLAASGLPTEGTTIASVPLAIWDLKGTSLSDGPVPSGKWHHQILHNGRAIAFARSRVTGERAEVVELSESPLASALEDALHGIRDSAGEHTILRLLRVETNHTTCLWLCQPDQNELIVLQSQLWRAGTRLDEATLLRMSIAALEERGWSVERFIQWSYREEKRIRRWEFRRRRRARKMRRGWA
jgi:KaiC/GvpD/RAD55 family RecA-like ATPase